MARTSGILTAFLASTAVHAAEPIRGELPLADGSTVATWTLASEVVTATVAPALGGKLVDLRLADGTPLLSRSDRPYRARVPGAAYGETEFDGMDECFPAVAAGPYPLPPWTERAVIDHGELCQQAWRVGDTSGGLTLQVDGIRFPYTFTRRLELHGDELSLDYRVDNRGEAPFACSYANHPLFAAAAGCGMELDDALPVRVALSRRGFLGPAGQRTTWGALQRADGRPFVAHQFAAGSGEYYKLLIGPLDTGAATYRLAAGHRVHLDWDATVMPYLALWVSAGAVGGLDHVGVEVARSRHDDLAAAQAAGEAALVPPGGSLAWTIRFRFEPADGGLPAGQAGPMLPDGRGPGR